MEWENKTDSSAVWREAAEKALLRGEVDEAGLVEVAQGAIDLLRAETSWGRRTRRAGPEDGRLAASVDRGGTDADGLSGGRHSDGGRDLFDGLHESISSSALGFSGIPMMAAIFF